MGCAACNRSTTRFLACAVPSHEPAGQCFHAMSPFWRSRSMRGWSFGIALRRGLERVVRADLDLGLLQRLDELLELFARAVVVDRVPEAVELIARHHVVARPSAEAVGREADVTALAQRRRDVRLVRRLVTAEAHVAVWPEDPAIAELRLEIREQLGHRPQHEVLVVALVVLPVRLRIVGLEALEERERLGRPSSECHARDAIARGSCSVAIDRPHPRRELNRAGTVGTRR